MTAHVCPSDIPGCVEVSADFLLFGVAFSHKPVEPAATFQKPTPGWEPPKRQPKTTRRKP